jgi:hypothetical protein
MAFTPRTIAWRPRFARFPGFTRFTWLAVTRREFLTNAFPARAVRACLTAFTSLISTAIATTITPAVGTTPTLATALRTATAFVAGCHFPFFRFCRSRRRWSGRTLEPAENLADDVGLFRR